MRSYSQLHSKGPTVVAFIVLLAALSVAGIVATIVQVTYTGPERVRTRNYGSR